MRLRKSVLGRVLFGIIIIMAVVFYVPTTKEAVTPEQKEAFTQYVTLMTQLEGERTKLMEQYDLHVTKAEKVTDAYRYLEVDFLPIYQTLVMNVEKVTPKEQALLTVHQHYTEATNLQNQAFTTYVQAYRQQETTLFEEANTTLAASNEEFVLFDQELRLLGENYDIKLPKPKK